MRSLFVISLLCFGKLLQAQQVYESYSPANGLVDARVTNMVQDKYGRLIFLSREGFSIFDGQRFTNYFSVDNVQVGITNEYIFMPDSSLYLLRFMGGAIRVTKNKVSYERDFINGLSEISSVKKIAVDDYLIISNKGIYRYTNKVLLKLRNQNPSLSLLLENSLSTAVFNHLLVLVRENGNKRHDIFLYDFQKQEILDHVATTLVNKIIEPGAGQLIVHFNTGVRQLDTAALRQGKLRFDQQPWFIKLLPPNFVINNISVDKFSRIWCEDLVRGIYRIDSLTGKNTFYPKGEGLLSGFTNVFIDAENNAWLIVPGKAVQKILQSNFEKQNVVDNKDFSICFLLYNMPGEGMFVNAASGCYLINGSSVKKLSDNNSPSIFPSFYWNHEIWHFTNFQTISSATKQKIFRFSGDTDSQAQVSTKVGIDYNGNIVIGGNSIYLLTKEGKTAATQLPYYSDRIAIDESNGYWAFCRGGLLAKYVYENGQLVQKYLGKISIDGIRCTAWWAKDTFLIGTRNEGLVIAKVAGDHFTILKRFNRENGLSNNFVLNVARLKNNSIAVGTASGLDIISINNSDTVFRKLSLSINNYEPIYNMDVDDSSRLYAASESTGNMFVYNSTKFNSLQYAPRAYISSIRVNSLLIENQSNFNYRQSDLIFQIAAPSFIDNRNINFYFKLVSENGEQAETNNTGTYELNNLEPGEYQLRIKVVYPAAIYPDAFLEYHFTIQQPFWKTWWFIALCLLSIILLVILFVGIFYRRKMEIQRNMSEKQQAIEKERARIATDMHDDFGANLSRIKFLSEKMQVGKNNPESLQTDLNKISIYSDEMAEKMGEIVWALNQQYDSLDDLISFSRAWASEYLQDKNIKLHFSAGAYPNVEIPGEVRRNIFLIIKEALHNVVKHAAAETVTIIFDYSGKLQVIIEDNGKGINLSSIRPFANGLENMKKRMQAINGSVGISSGSGTRIELLTGI